MLRTAVYFICWFYPCLAWLYPSLLSMMLLYALCCSCVVVFVQLFWVRVRNTTTTTTTNNNNNITIHK